MTKTAFITGAAGNLGHAVVQKFLDEGYQVIGTRTKNESMQISDARLELVENDCTDPDATDALVADIYQRYGAIDFAGLLAGGFGLSTIYNTSLDNLRKMISLNFETAFVTAQAVYKRMAEQPGKGHIAMVSAKPVFEPEIGTGTMSYTLSKSLLNEFAQLLNAEGKDKGVKASVVAPSILDTPPNREAMPNSNFDAWPKPSEVADTLAFIASDKAQALKENVIKIYGDL